MFTYVIKVEGLVQGVGFRPYIYKLAQEMNVHGWVENTTDGVTIILRTQHNMCNRFLEELKKNKPINSIIDAISVQTTETNLSIPDNFSIRESEWNGDQVTRISPDIPVCNDCLNDILVQPHRIEYPFVNCIHCGPRFSIVQSLPYERHNTAMHKYTMCPTCQKEYTNVNDRRFHAQPIACNHCGPHYTFIYNGKHYTNYKKIIKEAALLLQKGEILALKGIGGFNIICDAQNNEAIGAIRKLKKREAKPFAVMFASINNANEYAHISSAEAQLLTSRQNPIVLLKEKKSLAFEINKGLSTIGCLLPYLPIHYHLFAETGMPALLMTSGNMSDEPIIADNETALQKLLPATHGILLHDRDIYNQIDDSVAIVMRQEARYIRRARGVVPDTVSTPFATEGILAVGAEMVNTFAIGKHNQIIISQHIGDLKSHDTFCFLQNCIHKFESLFHFSPSLIVRDLHSGYHSSLLAEETATDKQIPLVAVQHHHAHMASCMIEHNLDENVIGIILDGTGLGTDGHLWGGEVLFGGLTDFERSAHFEYIPLPGGDKAIKETWRIAVALLHQYADIKDIPAYIKETIAETSITMICKMIDAGINTFYTSSAGRLFDGVAALTGICIQPKFQAEAAIRLEQTAANNCSDLYSYETKNSVISFRLMIQEIISDMNASIPVEIICAKFQNTIIQSLAEQAKNISIQKEVTKVVLSGGCFQNKYLSEVMEQTLERLGLRVFVQQQIPCNDGGICAGQMAIAAKRRQQHLL